jgi:uncharacterized protein (UPF0548 family)
VRLVEPLRPRSIERALAAAVAATPTYDDAVRAGGPSRYSLDRLEGVVGHGDRDLAAARTGLRSWATHTAAGLRVFPSSETMAVGITCLVTFGIPLLAIAAPCRVTRVIDEPRRAGFTYATLPGHPEEGEESFVVAMDVLGDVRFTIEARSRPSSALGRAAAPIGRRVQHRVAAGYLRSLGQFVAREAGPPDARA